MRKKEQNIEHFSESKFLKKHKPYFINFHKEAKCAYLPQKTFG